MRTIRRAFLFFGFLGACFAGHAANHMVQSGQSLQTTLNNAASGDLVLLQDGFYDEDCVVSNKAITIRSISPSSIPAVQVRSITITNSPAPSTLSHIRLLSDLNASGATVTLRNCNVFGSLNKTNGDLKVYSSNVDGNVTATKAGLTLLKSTVDGDVTVTDAQDDATRELEAIVVQSTIGERFVCKAKRSLTCYNLIRHAYFEGEVEITGNEFDGRTSGFGGIGIDVNGTTTIASIRNNLIHDYHGNFSENMTDQCIGIRITGGARADIVNNLIFDCIDFYNGGNETNCGMGIFVQSTAGTKILGNAIWACGIDGHTTSGDCAVWAPIANVLLKNNYLLRGQNDGNAEAKGGVQSVDNVHNNSNTASTLKFVGSGDYHLQADSPLKNTGPADAIYNDRDGTRNDIGMYGGHNYIPNGRTTTKPIPIKLKTAPIFVPAGGVITIESTGGTSK